MADQIEQPPAIPAAALIVMRPRLVGPPDILFIRRASTLAFAAGAYAFPGGRVDPEDRPPAEAADGKDMDAEDRVARLCAIRETLEETGLAIGHDPSPDREAIARWRAGTERQLPIGLGARLAPERLVPFARWLPSEHVVRRFDTRFYLVEADTALDPIPDGGEIEEAFWAPAQAVLDRCKAGQGRALFPTRRLLERLALFTHIEDAMADAIARPERIITPWVEQIDGRDWLRIPEDAGYPVNREIVETAMRY